MFKRWVTKNNSVIVGKNTFKIYQEGKTQNPLKMWIEGLKPTINIPFYHYLWEEDKNYNLQGDTELSQLRCRAVTLFMPDDAVEVDRKIIGEYYDFKIGVKKLHYTYQCLHLAKSDKPYLSVAKTSRCLVISFVHHGEIVTQEFLPLTIEEEVLGKSIKRFKDINCYEELSVYINNVDEDMDAFTHYGTLVSANQMMNF